MMASHDYARAFHAHSISNSLGISFWASWQVATCIHKRTYSTLEAAEQAAKRYGQRAYRCDVCQRWHTTSKPQDGACASEGHSEGNDVDTSCHGHRSVENDVLDELRNCLERNEMGIS